MQCKAVQIAMYVILRVLDNRTHAFNLKLLSL